jgi:hypothetical protein
MINPYRVSSQPVALNPVKPTDSGQRNAEQPMHLQADSPMSSPITPTSSPAASGENSGSEPEEKQAEASDKIHHLGSVLDWSLLQISTGFLLSRIILRPVKPAAERMVQGMKPGLIKKWLPTIADLVAIPIVLQPTSKISEWLMETTIRPAARTMNEKAITPLVRVITEKTSEDDTPD